MNLLHYIGRSLAHYWFAYLGVLAGAVLGATALLGALFAGDSVAASLRRIAELRIGRTTHLVSAGDRFFRAALAEDMAQAANVRVAPVIYARGTAGRPTTRAVVNQVQLIGVTNAFWTFAPEPPAVALPAGSMTVAINETLARQLEIATGDTLIVRLQQPGILAGNAPVAGAESALQSMRVAVGAIVDDAGFGRFTLETTQVPMATVFLPIALLQENLERAGRANLLLIEGEATSDALRGALTKRVTLADYGLTLTWREKAQAFEVASDRVFIDPEQAGAVLQAADRAEPVISYLVNEFRRGERTTPYSIATATTAAAAPFLPADLGPREIVLNEWLAEDLQASVGDDVRVTYFQVGAADVLVEQYATFRVRGIVPLQGLAADPDWMPTYPGITDTNNQSDWDPGLPLDLRRVRDKDERYWDDYRGTPKAFLSLAAGREIWSTRWGNTTAVRIPFERAREAELTSRLLSALRPEMNQLLVRDVRTTAQDAAQSPVDFGGLFIGMSFFLICAALGLVAMLFQLSLLQRNREDALLGSVGLPAGRLLRWRLVEGGVILLIAAGLGFGCASLYTRGILRFLETIWAGQGAGETFVFAATPVSVVAGGGGFLLFSMVAIWLAIRKQTRRALSIRLAAHVEDTAAPEKVRRTSGRVALIAAIAGAGAIGASGRGLPVQGAFYLGGFLLLIAGIAACRAWMASATKPSRAAALESSYLGVLNLKARRARNLTVVGLIATAVFMVLSVASFRKHVGSDWLERASGTGGFTFWIETTAAQNPARDGRSGGFEIFARHATALSEIVPLRVGIGDNANCFNLNTTAQPRLLAVDAATLARREAFRVKLPTTETAKGWEVLRTIYPDGALPALVDETTLLWALKRKVGDVLSYSDENGRAFDVRIAGTLPDSVFQGHLMIDEQRFLEHFPSSPGYALFLVEAKNPAEAETLREGLAAAVADLGGRVDLTRDVLAAFHRIENTYIAIFNVLGTLGVVLGSLGLAIVVARNLRERRSEFGVLMAIGIPRGVLARMIFAEYGRLVLWGIVIGAVASAIAVWPGLAALPAGPTLLLVGALIVGIVGLNFASGWGIFYWTLRNVKGTTGQEG